MSCPQCTQPNCFGYFCCQLLSCSSPDCNDKDCVGECGRCQRNCMYTGCHGWECQVYDVNCIDCRTQFEKGNKGICMACAAQETEKTLISEMDFYFHDKNDVEVIISLLDEEAHQRRDLQKKLDKHRHRFLDFCTRYHPTINQQLIDRISKQKAFI